MKAYALVLIVSGPVFAAILFLISFHERGGRKKRIEHPTAAEVKDNTLPSNGHLYAEEGLNVDTGGEAKEDGTAFVVEAALAAVGNLSSEGEVGLSNSSGGDNATYSSADGDGYGGGKGGGGAGCGSG